MMDDDNLRQLLLLVIGMFRQFDRIQCLLISLTFTKIVVLQTSTVRQCAVMADMSSCCVTNSSY